MPVFAYSATDVAGQSVHGTLIADTPADGRQRLREQGLSIVSFQTAGSRRAPLQLALGSARRHSEKAAEVARYLGLLLRAGVPLAESLEVLARESDKTTSGILKDLRDRVSGGDSFADTLGRHPGLFDGVFVSAVRMGELSGNLDEALSELAAHLRSRQTLQNRLTNALAYPLILTVVGTAVVLFLMSYVVPQLVTVLDASGRPLPASTAFLKRVSDFLVNRWPFVLGTSFILLFAGTLLSRNPQVRRGFQRAVLTLPLLGALLRKSLVASFAQQMSLLLKTGIPFVDAVRSVSGQSKNLVLNAELDAIARSVESGCDIAPTLSGSRIFPPVVAHLVAVGQDSGELTGMLAELRDRYEDEVQLALGRFATVLEPLLIVVLAAVIGFVVFACLMPILEATKGIT